MKINIDWFKIDEDECLTLGQGIDFDMKAQSLLSAVKKLQMSGEIPESATIHNYEDEVITVVGGDYIGLVAKEGHPIIKEIQQQRELFTKISKLANLY